MLAASHLAGRAFTWAGLGLAHSLGEPLGAFHHLRHGLCMALFLPVVMDFNRPAAAPRLARLARALGADTAGADDADSGSQVIALEGEEVFGDEEVGGPALLADEPAGLETPLEALESGADAAVPVVTPMAMGAVAELPEAEYSGWNIAGLAMTMFVMLLGGLLMTDVVRNIWSWNGDFSATSSLMDLIVSSLGFK